MVSKISITEFKERLKNNTKYGPPKIKGTPFAIFTLFGESNKIFFGTYSKTKFELTKNSTLFPTVHIISGEIKSIENNKTEINYVVKPIGFGYYWNKYMPIIAIPIFNLILYTNSFPLKAYKIINPVIVGIAILCNFLVWRNKNKLINHFEKVFEIES
ncbi:hypothetical protein FCR2A7T_06890 [Flavobacterium cauense R2A-7]|uniref:Uncharacterized protein n=1 Tax=Flavobacterium cauense R2A-7 TaxID=1341154 RepID=V6S3N1_9FLAO|nr:hypothetical protein [Flavobacterium cauense]ESU21261.1 hypothetical protein FCR2A7T_06890 [Flavobacterium cauense R2A-7]KGO79019.1 hypothetical protein Q762_14720 [Flavobacterium cauense R2A-7]TWI07390.1 hypothetical protein IP98_02948 [Flavobacterium cauense R2A-7]